MKVVATELPDVLVVEPQVHRDARGFFLETWAGPKYAQHGITATFVQDNHSRSARGTLRGLHLQWPRAQAKLLRTVVGEIFDVAVDVRRGSLTFGRWVGVVLSAENFRQLYIPEGFAHGFCVLSEVAEVEYKCSDVYVPEDEITVLWNDPAIGVRWPVSEPLLSKRDEVGKTLAELSDRLPVQRA
ncbi:MAG: dTDP-4-dehydrorhamnose 3,5-epimerase [Proteobacteria bacterium]|nr:MAG: dTDP-4-dehydrorhamnose 3,5-epimerase [Pseudomonadota bacterium]